MALLLAATEVRTSLVVDLVDDHRIARRLLQRPPVTDTAKRLRPFLDVLVTAIEQRLRRDLEMGTYGSSRLLFAAEHLATALDIENELGDALDRIFELLDDGRAYGPISQLRDARTRLDDDGRSVLEPPAAFGRVLELLHADGEWDEAEPCGEPLFQAVPEPRRFPLASLISRRYRRTFDLLIVDESHEFNGDRSAQTKALHRLMGLPGITTVLLTGSLMGGYASALFPNAWATNHDLRAELERGDRGLFVKRYGYQKVMIEARKAGGNLQRGTFTDREVGVRRVGEAPGVHPTYITRFLLPSTVILHKADLDVELPPLIEEPFPLAAQTDEDRELIAEYSRLQSTLLERIREDRFDPDRAGRLLGALVELPSYLDRCTADLDPFEIVYPEVGDQPASIIATAKAFPRRYRTPKERFLLARVRDRLAQGENVLVFLRHTGSAALPHRLLRLIERHATSSCAWLDAKKVPTAKRQQWIENRVSAKNVRVLLVNPNAVRTGLNCLTRFSSVIWHQLDYSATTYRQANGRAHRIGQERPVWVATPYIAGTAQEIAFNLVAAKVSASLQVDGLDLQAALEAAGASEEAAGARAAAMSLGETIYRKLAGAA